MGEQSNLHFKVCVGDVTQVTRSGLFQLWVLGENTVV